MASGGLIIVNPIVDIVLTPIESFQRETKVKVRAEIYNMFSKKAQVQWEIYPTSAPKEKVILPVKTVVAANGRKQLEKLFEGLNPNTEYTIVARVTNLGEISGGTVIGEYWKTTSAKTLIMSRNLQAYRIGTGNVTARLINLTKYPYDRKVKFFYKKKGESKYKLSETVALPEGENGNIIHLYSSLQQNTEYIFYVEVYRTDKNQRISYLSMTKTTNIYVPDGIPDPYVGEIIEVPHTCRAVARAMWEGLLQENLFVTLLYYDSSQGSFVPYTYANRPSLIIKHYKLTAPRYVEIKKGINGWNIGDTVRFKFAVAREQTDEDDLQLVGWDGTFEYLKYGDEFEITFDTLPDITDEEDFTAVNVQTFANAFETLARYKLALSDDDYLEGLRNRLLENTLVLETGQPIYGGTDSVFANIVNIINRVIPPVPLILGAITMQPWEDHSEEPISIAELTDYFAELKEHLEDYRSLD